MSNQYYKIGAQNGRNGKITLQFHTGPNRELVRSMCSLNHGIDITEENAERIMELLEEWNMEIDTYGLKPTNT